MAGEVSELLAALEGFKTGMKDLAISRATQDATEQVNSINQTIADEGEKRAQLQQLSNQFALRLTGIGANANQVSQAAQAVAPQQINSVEQAILQGALTSSPDLTSRGLAAQELIQAPELNVRQQGLDLQRQQINNQASQFNRQQKLQEAQMMLQNAQLEQTADSDARKAVSGVLDSAGLNIVQGLPSEMTKEQRQGFLGNVGLGNAQVSALALDPSQAPKIREQFATLNTVKGSINQLRDLAGQTGGSLNPKTRAAADALQTTLIGLLRTPITGPGAMSESDRKLLEQLAANPVGIFKYKGGALEGLNRLENVMTRTAANGLQQQGVQLLAPLNDKQKEALAYVKRNPKDPKAGEVLQLIEQQRQIQGARLMFQGVPSGSAE